MHGQRPRCADPARLLATDWQAEAALRADSLRSKARMGATIAAAREGGWSWRQIATVMPMTTARDRYVRHIAGAEDVAA